MLKRCFPRIKQMVKLRNGYQSCFYHANDSVNYVGSAASEKNEEFQVGNCILFIIQKFILLKGYENI